ncbi:6228_t:CDS:2 [Gigaspora margarita]|uniref:6228_t:CDS:1 n=1 Tax=Gigaspora margarita TaxID=4874 RepID=A0ABM8VYU0_GIGMA|nr:6228_t:CDS:2 [Gigaspora margarita]
MQIDNNIEANKFENFLLRIGNGTENTIDNDMICIPDNIVIDWNDEQSLQILIEQVYPHLPINSQNNLYFTNKAILTTKNEYVNNINNTILNQLPGEDITYRSFDSVLNDTRNLYEQEFLNSITMSEISPYKLRLKTNAPIICLRNLDPTNSLCNSTKLTCRAFSPNVIEAEIITDNHQGKQDRQVGLYLPEHVFAHGQLYVAFSQVRSYQNIKVLIKNGKIPGKQETYTRNIIYKEILCD